VGDQRVVVIIGEVAEEATVDHCTYAGCDCGVVERRRNGGGGKGGVCREWVSGECSEREGGGFEGSEVLEEEWFPG